MIATGNHIDFDSLRDAPRSLVRNDTSLTRSAPSPTGEGATVCLPYISVDITMKFDAV